LATSALASLLPYILFWYFPAWALQGAAELFHGVLVVSSERWRFGSTAINAYGVSETHGATFSMTSLIAFLHCMVNHPPYEDPS